MSTKYEKWADIMRDDIIVQIVLNCGEQYA